VDRPFYLTTIPAVGGIARRTYSTLEGAERYARQVVEAYPLAVVSIHERLDDECSRFVKGVAHPRRLELLAKQRAEAVGATGEGGA